MATDLRRPCRFSLRSAEVGRSVALAAVRAGVGAATRAGHERQHLEVVEISRGGGTGSTDYRDAANQVHEDDCPHPLERACLAAGATAGAGRGPETPARNLEASDHTSPPSQPPF